MKKREPFERLAGACLGLSGLVILVTLIYFGITTPILGVFFLSVTTLGVFLVSLGYLQECADKRKKLNLKEKN